MKRVVLVRPLGPRNVGSIARAAANFAPAELVLVAPPRRSILIHPDFVQMAHGAEGVAEQARVVPTLADALADCTSSVGFTARPRGHEALLDWRDARDEIARRAADPGERLALVFGSEEGGLSRAETEPLQELVRIPTADEHASLNLAAAVTVVLAHLFLESGPEPAGAPSSAPLLGRDREFLVRRAAAVLGEQTWSDAARRDVEAAVERTLRRAPLETRDARAWHLLLRALGDESTPGDLA